MTLNNHLGNAHLKYPPPKNFQQISYLTSHSTKPCNQLTACVSMPPKTMDGMAATVNPLPESTAMEKVALT